MNKKTQKKALSEAQVVLDAVRRIVQSLRTFSKFTERDFGISTAQIYVLQTLRDHEHPLSVNELAEATHTHQSSVSVVISKLVQRNLILRTVCENDSRSFKLSLSTEGEYLLSKSPISFQQQLVNGLNLMSPEARKGLVDGLTSLIEKTGLQSEEAVMLMEDDDHR